MKPLNRKPGSLSTPPRSIVAARADGPSDAPFGQPTLAIHQVDYKIARTRSELTGAFTLLQRRYTDAGLSATSRMAMRVMPYHLWPHTQVFVALRSNQVIGTVSLVRDAPDHGVPMESAYGDTIRRLRGDAVPFAEVCSLSVQSPPGESTGNIFGQLTRLMMFHARHVGLDTLVAVVHPRHQKFYQRAMGFQTIGGVKRYLQAAGRPGVPILGSVNDRSAYRSRWQRFYFDGDFSDDDLAPNHLALSDRTFFRQFVVGRDHVNRDSRAA